MSFTPKVRTLEEFTQAYKGLKAKMKELEDEGYESSSVYRELLAAAGTIAWAMGSEADDGRSIVPSDEYILFRKSLW